MLSMSMSDMPNKACPFPGTTKNVHNFVYYCALFLPYICQIVLLLFCCTFLLEIFIFGCHQLFFCCPMK